MNTECLSIQVFFGFSAVIVVACVALNAELGFEAYTNTLLKWPFALVSGIGMAEWLYNASIQLLLSAAYHADSGKDLPSYITGGFQPQIFVSAPVIIITRHRIWLIVDLDHPQAYTLREGIRSLCTALF